MRRIGVVPAVLVLTVLLPAAAQARAIHVHPGGSIQRAVDAARPGDAVVVHAGTYREHGRPCIAEPDKECAVVIKRSHIRLIGRGSRHRRVVLKPMADQDKGIGVAKTRIRRRPGLVPSCLTRAGRSRRVHGSYISGLTIKGFEDDGVHMFCVDHYRVTRVRAIDDREYGIFPSHSISGRVDHSYARGANDTGIYIGQSRKGRMDHNLAEDNLNGFEIENSSRIRADHNRARGNTGGIISVALPNLQVKSNRRNVIDHNRVGQNDRRNTCLDPEDVICKVPRGTGILVLAADSNRLSDNRVTGNDSYGIAVANYCIALSISKSACDALDIDPNPDFNRVVSNRVTGNAGQPDPSVPSVFRVDLAWDLSGSGDCWAKNVATSSFPASLPACP